MTTGRSERGRHLSRPRTVASLPRIALVLAAFAFRPDPAAAQFVPGDRDPSEPRRTEGCEESVARPLQVENGIVRLRIVSPCRKGQTLRIHSTEATFEGEFDRSGELTAYIPIFHDPAVLRWQDAGGQEREEQVRFPNIRRVFKVALFWKGDVTLSLRVNEALSLLPGARCLWFRRGDTCRGLGRFDLSAQTRPSDTHFEIYTIPDYEPVRGGRLSYRVFFESRVAGEANAAYCGSGRWAEPAFELWVLKNGIPMRDSRLSRFGRLACSEVKSEPSYGQSETLLGP